MYCENCGHKLNEHDLFCEDCGSKVNRVFSSQPKSSNKTLWIVLGCIFGGFFLFFVLILIFIFGVFNYSVIDEETYDYEINDYIEEYEDISSIESF